MKKKITLHTGPIDHGPFHCFPALEWELEPERVLTNDVHLPWESHFHNCRLWVIWNEFGALGAVWANCEQDALDNLCDEGLSGGLMVDDQDQDNEDGALTHLGNAGELHDLTHAGIASVVFDKARDVELLCRFAEARGNGSNTLDD